MSNGKSSGESKWDLFSTFLERIKMLSNTLNMHSKSLVCWPFKGTCLHIQRMLCKKWWELELGAPSCCVAAAGGGGVLITVTLLLRRNMHFNDRRDIRGSGFPLWETCSLFKKWLSCWPVLGVCNFAIPLPWCIALSLSLQQPPTPPPPALTHSTDCSFILQLPFTQPMVWKIVFSLLFPAAP